MKRFLQLYLRDLWLFGIFLLFLICLLGSAAIVMLLLWTVPGLFWGWSWASAWNFLLLLLLPLLTRVAHMCLNAQVH